MLLLVAATAAAACGRSREPAVIGLAYSPSSRNVEAARLAASDLAELSRRSPITLFLDSSFAADSAAVEVRRAERLVAVPGLVAVVGPSNSRGTLAAAPVYNAAGVSQINPGATSHLLTRLDGRTLTMIPNDSIEGAFITEYIAQVSGIHNVAIFFANDEYGIGLREGVESAMVARGLHVVDKVPFSPGGNFPVLIRASLRRAVPDVFVVAGRVAETTAIARAINQLAPGTMVVAGDGALVPDRLGQLGDSALASLRVVSFWLPASSDTTAMLFSRRFRALFGREPEPSDAYLYDGIMVSAAAIQAAGADRDAVWGWLRSLGTSRPAYSGVTGPIVFGKGATSHLVMARIRNGRAVAEWRR